MYSYGEIKMKILIAEDEPTGREILKNLLSRLGTCETAENGEEAVAMFAQAAEDNSPYDLIMMDIMMPRLSGHEAIEQIRNIEKEHAVPPAERVTIMMTTALGDQKNVAQAFFKGGAASYIVKPIDKDQLFDQLRKQDVIP